MSKRQNFTSSAATRLPRGCLPRTTRPRWLRGISLVALTTTGLTTLVGLAHAQQVVANSPASSQSITGGTYDTGTASDANGYVLWATHGGVISADSSASPLAVRSGGSRADVVVAGDGGTINLANAMVTAAGGGGGLLSGSYVSSATGGLIKADNVVVKTTTGIGVQASNGGSVVLEGGSVTTTAGGFGLYASAQSGAIQASGTSVSTEGDQAYGAAAFFGGSISLNGGSVSTTGNSAMGLISFNAGATIKATDITIATSGSWAQGVQASSDSSVTLNGGSVNTSGSAAYGLYTIGPGAWLTANGTTVATKGGSAYGAFASSGKGMELTDVRLTTSGPTAHGVYADGEDIANGIPTITLADSQITTHGSGSYGLLSVSGGTINATDVALATTGDNAHGLVALDANSTITGSGVNITTVGNGAGGLMVAGGAINLTDSIIHAQGDGISLAASSSGTSAGGTVNIAGGEVVSSAGSAIVANAGTGEILLSDGAHLVGGNGTLLDVYSAGTVAILDASGDVVLTGDVRADEGAVANVSLSQSSSITGAMHNAGSVTIDASSQWNITGSSDVAQLALSGVATFAAPAPDYKSLTVHGDLSGGGTVVMNTLLNQGGALVNQSTDRILVEGNASGTTLLKVFGQGDGSFTDTNRNGVMEPNEGISFVQVAGHSTANAFQLAGGYVAVGPWRYGLSAYQPGTADANQRVVAGSGDGYWDYRLQSAWVAPPPPPDSGGSNPPPDNGGGSNPPPRGRPQVVPQVPSYLSLGPALYAYGARNIATLHDRQGEARHDASSPDNEPDDFYARVFGGDYSYKSNFGFRQFGYDFTQSDHTVQIGGTWLKFDQGTSLWRLGAYGYTGTSHVTPSAVDGVSQMRIAADGLAATATYEHASGFYVDGIVSRDHYDTSVDTAERGADVARLNTHGWSYSLESGYPFPFIGGARIEPQVQLIYQSLQSYDAIDTDGLSVTQSGSHQWLGRLGARLSKTYQTGAGNPWTPWMSLDVLGSWGGTSQAILSSDAWGVSQSFTTSKFGNVVRLGTGVTGALSHNVSLHGDAGYQTELGRTGEHGWSFNLGLRWKF
jgi:autotransporter family porin